ncbi:MAG: DUF3293 domain-containing protein [Akkermansiaceae bacterium]|jgi:hypothetical protein|nr:DUF3293 domain-containing protein [Akkermansiaceae bacterium]
MKSRPSTPDVPRNSDITRPADLPTGYDACRFKTACPLPPGDFSIVTAWNPMDRCWSVKMNRAADLRLKRWLERRSLPRLRVTCCGEDGGHSEEGWMIPTDFVSSHRLARHFRQRAFWWIQNGRLHLVHCRSGSCIPIADFPKRLSPETEAD